MHGTTSALVVAAAIAAASLPVAASAQSTGGPSSVNPYAGYTPPAMPPAHVLDRAGISPEELQTYARVRHDLMQDPNVASLLRQPEDLRTEALDRYLDRNRTGMDAEEFIRVHRAVQNDPELRAAVEGGTASAASGSDAAASTPEAALERAGISQQQLDTYARVRHDLMQDPNVASLLRQPEDLRTQALDRYLDRNRTGMDAEEFIRIHRTVENNPQLRAYVESGPSSGAAQSGTSATGAAPSASPK
ncbi:MAG TPA: hypothetical protein VF406_09055 [Thermodesulfobacteriota bacterium]